MNDIANKERDAKQKLLWDVAQERRAQGRHSESLRANVCNYLLIVASILVAAITYDKVINKYDLALAIMMTLTGFVGKLFCASYTERYHRNKMRASALINEIDKITTFGNSPTITAIEEEARKSHFNDEKYRKIFKTANSHLLWQAFPIIITITGITLIAFSIFGWNSIPPH